LIGKACISVTKYYDSSLHRLGFKQRPILVIGLADPSDYVVLPISRVTNQVNLDPVYDFPMEISTYPRMNLRAKSYIRSHKQFAVNSAEITKVICDFRQEYPSAYLDVLTLVERFQKDLIASAL